MSAAFSECCSTPKPATTSTATSSATQQPRQEQEQQQQHDGRCPLSRKCKLAKEETVLSHLRKHHSLQEYTTARGTADISMPIRLDGSMLRKAQVVGLRYDGRTFLWSFETRARADGEQQMSLVVYLLSEEDCVCSNDDEEDAAASCSSTPTTSSTPTCTTATTKASSYRVNIVTTDEEGKPPSSELPACPSWSGKVQCYDGHHHDWMISRGLGVVVCHLAHNHLFSKQQRGSVMQLHTSVSIHRVEE